MGAVYISLVSICSMLYNAVDIHTAGDNKYIISGCCHHLVVGGGASSSVYTSCHLSGVTIAHNSPSLTSY